MKLLTTSVELQGRLKSDLLRSRIRFGVRLLCCVESVDIGLMVFLVMQLHDFFGDVGFEGLVDR
jgi:hypothetical protein